MLKEICFQLLAKPIIRGDYFLPLYKAFLTEATY
jgi:hypothetical protein